MSRRNWALEYETYAEKLIRAYGTPGVAVMVARDGIPIYERGFGFRDRENALPVTINTVFGIGSITKSMTCVAIMQLQEEGKLSVHDPIIKYIPEFFVVNEQFTRQITIHHFMTHTSGLPPTPTLFHALYRSIREDPSARERLAQVGPGEPIDTLGDLIAFLAKADITPLGRPGCCFSYFNDGYAILGAIIERLSGLDLETYFQERIFRPAGMEHSTFLQGVMGEYPDVATIYAVRDQDGQEAVYRSNFWWEAPAMLAAGFVKSSARDMIRYLEIFRTGGTVGGNRILSAQSVGEMITPYAVAAPGMGYGYGLMITQNYHGVTLIEHGGALKGIAAWVSVVPEKGLTAVVLTNLAGSPASSLALGAINAELGLPLHKERVDWQEQSCPIGRLPLYAGTYRSAEGEMLTFHIEGDRLACEIQGKKWPVRCVGEHTFLVKIKEQEFPARFLFEGSGPAHAVAYHYRIIRRVTDHG